MRTSSGLQEDNNGETGYSQSPLTPEQLSLHSLSFKSIPISQNAITELLDLAREFSEKFAVVLQFFDRSAIHGPEHLYAALFHALRAEASGRSRTRALSVDIARFAAGERQIYIALKKVGLRESSKHIIALVFFPHGTEKRQEKILHQLEILFSDFGLESGPPLESHDGSLQQALEDMSSMELKL